MFVLQLNDMRSPKIETLTNVCRSEEKNVLEKLLRDELVDSYYDEKWKKHYKKGGLLEWYNLPYITPEYIVDIGTVKDWMNNAKLDYENLIYSIRKIDV